VKSDRHRAGLKRSNMVYYVIRSKQSGLVLDIKGCCGDDGATICMWEYTGADNQLWSYEGGQLRSKLNGKVLDLKDCNASAGNDVCMWSDNGGPNQRWYLCEDNTICSEMAGDMALDIMDNSTDPGADVKIWNKHGNPNQQFVLEIAPGK